MRDWHLFHPAGWIKRSWRALKRKRKARSPFKLLLDALNWLAWIAQIAVAGVLAYQKNQNSPDSKLALGFVIAAVYAMVHKVWLSGLFKPRRLEIEAARRPERLSVGLGQVSSILTSVLATGKPLSPIVERLERVALESIQSEVQAYIGDVEGFDINVSLIVERDQERVCCINRASLTRDVPKYYLKPEMLAWRAIQTGKTEHAPDLGKNSKNYRSVLCIPILYVSDEDTSSVNIRCLGVTTIDSKNPYEFWDIDGKLQLVVEPYVRLLAISVFLRNQGDIWPWHPSSH